MSHTPHAPLVVAAVVIASSVAAVATVAAVRGTAGCGREVADPISADVDFADPKSVLGGLIHAARSGDPALLARLCDPGGASEASVRRICALGPGTSEWASFKAEFRNARINGEPRVHVDHAALNFVYGERATRVETMELVQRDGRWYLLRF